MTKGYEARPTGVAGLAAELKRMQAEIERLRQKVVSLSAPDSIIGKPVTSGIVTAAAGWTVDDYQIRDCASTVHLAIRVTRTGVAITASATGHITNADIATVAPQFRWDIGYFTYIGAAWSNVDAQEQAWNLALGTSGQLQIVSSTIPNASIATSDRLWALFSWPLGA